MFDARARTNKAPTGLDARPPPASSDQKKICARARAEPSGVNTVAAATDINIIVCAALERGDGDSRISASEIPASHGKQGPVND